MYFKYTEGNISCSDWVRSMGTWRGRRPHACMEAICAGVGRPCVCP